MTPDIMHSRNASRPALTHSASFDQRRRPETLRTAMAMAFFCNSPIPRVRGTKLASFFASNATINIDLEEC